YALGALMYKLLTGELPAGVDGDPALVRSGAPAALRALIERSLSDDPERRHPGAGELARELRAIPRVAGDAPTIRAAPASASAGDRPRSGDGSQTLAGRGSTPFSSLVTVERDGDRVRFSLGLPAMGLLVALILGLVWMARQGPEAPAPEGAPPPSPPLAS